MTDKKLLGLFGLKYNPFLPDIPYEDLWQPPGIDSFFFRVENLVIDGGFALITAEPGLGKSKFLQLLAGRLDQIGDLVVGVAERPQSTLGDLYREMGDLFGVTLTPTNRYGGFKALRARWRAHMKSSLLRPVLLIDEAQLVPPESLNELRLLSSAHFDSECLLTTVLCGDHTLPDRFRGRDLLAFGSRVRTRLILEPHARNDLLDFLEHITDKAGAPGLMTKSLQEALVDHCGGNLRILCGMGAELLAAGAEQKVKKLNDQLFLEVFGRKPPPRRRPRHTKGATS